MNDSFFIRPVDETDREWVLECVRGWGAEFIVTRGRKAYPQDLPAFVAVGGTRPRVPLLPADEGPVALSPSGQAQESEGERVGLITYEFMNDECEIVTLDAFRKFQGIGTALIEAVVRSIRATLPPMKKNRLRLWLITTNDNLDAIRFYQCRGFRIATVHVGAMEESRGIKPTIPEIGEHGIPLRDEIEFEMWVCGGA